MHFFLKRWCGVFGGLRKRTAAKHMQLNSKFVARVKSDVIEKY